MSSAYYVGRCCLALTAVHCFGLNGVCRRIVVAPDGATVAVIMSSGIGESLCKSSTPQNETEETFQKVESLRS